MSEEKPTGGLKENKLTHGFNTLADANARDPEARQLKNDFELARGDNPDALAGRIAPGGTALAKAIAEGTTRDKKKKEEHDRRMRNTLIADMIRAIHQRIAELDIIIENLREGIEKNLERIAALDETIERRTKTIEQISEYLRTGKLERQADGSLSDPAMNILLRSYLDRNNLRADDLNAYTLADIRMFLDAEAADQRAAQERERIEQRRLAKDTDGQTAAMNEAVEERKRLQEIKDEYERIQNQAPSPEKDWALDQLMQSLDSSQIRKLQKTLMLNEGNSGTINEKTNEVDLMNLGTTEQKATPTYMKDLGM